jgi:VWFA-related protein
MNTAFTDRAYARQEMLKFLSSMPAGQPIALFTLSGKLTMVQGFTQSSDALIAAAKAMHDKNENAHLQTTEEELEDSEAIDAQLAAMAGRSPASVLSLSQSLQNEQAYQLDVRVRTTLACLQALAQSVAGYPGRKNLIWLSGDFPIALGPEFDNRPELPNYLLYQSSVHETSTLLASSQIAVYPIDVRGLEITGMNARMRQAPTSAQRDRQINSNWSTQFTMNEIARETGGEAFYNQNDLNRLMQRSLDEGSNYYTLAYVPENHNWNGAFRKIDVKLGVEGVKLRNRSGYYALADQAADQNIAAHLLAAAMQPTVPESTRLLMKVQVLPPSAEHKSVTIDFAISPSDLAFSDGDEQRKIATVDFMAVALDKKLKECGITTNTVDAHMRPETYQNIFKTGFPGHLELELKPGKYVIRLGAIDRNTQKIGTVDVPLEVPVLSAKK